MVDIATENFQNAVLSKPDKLLSKIWTRDTIKHLLFKKIKIRLLSHPQTLYVRS